MVTIPGDPADHARTGPEPGVNRLLPLITEGRAPIGVLAELAAQEHHIVRSDLRSLLLLATRCAGTRTGRYFADLAGGEEEALVRLARYGAACGLDGEALRSREPLAGCQAYPAYLAWLALNGEPTAVVLAFRANAAAWGGYCAAVAVALRTHYGFDDASCGFFDFFARPAPSARPGGTEVPADHTAEDAALLGEAPDPARAVARGERYGRLLESYELMFWNTLADLLPGTPEPAG
ncbi:thiaminase II/PqqC family protein [Peterkaempfera bronchialis]|uniref:Transcriptional regulator n=1 Tax=Peterkaempfera bronchialis TaxID=2126346 RepID=A0A345SRP1_9ACTN|nr:transcriptional regulator [Peterkaempfera bronchialis]AXI76396.1 transcriptional regulator [Peterkaempfera bronchialis]